MPGSLPSVAFSSWEVSSWEVWAEEASGQATRVALPKVAASPGDRSPWITWTESRDFIGVRHLARSARPQHPTKLDRRVWSCPVTEANDRTAGGGPSAGSRRVVPAPGLYSALDPARIATD